MTMAFEPLKVGELARRTGLTVRSLHHYDEIGLLKPSLHSDAGHRLYTADDVARLQQVVSLRQLGFSLEEVRDCLNRPDFSPLEVIKLHRTRLREQIEQQRMLCERLDALAELFRAAEKVSADEFLRTIEVMTMIENYYTPDQLETLRQRREAPGGDELVQQGTADWAELFAQLTAEMERGTDPADPRVQALEQRRQALVNAFTGGDAGIEQSLTKLWTEQGDQMAAQFGYDPKLLHYLGQVAAAAAKLA
ncbi:MAG TPA: MerR family transcriptional regulator [Planctomycetaceae bacterium]|nr:MerR family transcriptional regulator [Planctomycetaceae bacterium]